MIIKYLLRLPFGASGFFVFIIGVMIYGVAAHAQSSASLPLVRDSADQANRRLQRTQDLGVERSVSRADLFTLTNQCSSISEQLKSERERLQIVLEAREETYSQSIQTLRILKERIEATGFDATSLEKNTAEVQKMAVILYQHHEVLDVAFKDMIELDCEADIEGFILALEDARASILLLRESATSIKDYISGPVRETIRDAASLLSDKADTE